MRGITIGMRSRTLCWFRKPTTSGGSFRKFATKRSRRSSNADALGHARRTRVALQNHRGNRNGRDDGPVDHFRCAVGRRCAVRRGNYRERHLPSASAHKCWSIDLAPPSLRRLTRTQSWFHRSTQGT